MFFVLAFALLSQDASTFLNRIDHTPLIIDGQTVSRIDLDATNSVIRLRLDGMRISENEFKSLSEFKRLRSLSLRRTNVGDAHLAHLNLLTRLQYLSLVGTHVTDGVVSKVLSLPRLDTVSLDDSTVTSAAIQRLKHQFAAKKRQVMVDYVSRVDSTVKELFSASNSVTAAAAVVEEEMKPYEERIRHTNVSIRMLPIPGGEFQMGSAPDEKERAIDEGPQRSVRISPFWMAETETTWDAFDIWVNDWDIANRENLHLAETQEDREAVEYQLSQPTAPYLQMDMGMGKSGYPAIMMTQLAARTFCQWLSAKTGRYYRLPTEAEWEYACRAGTTTAYSWGDDVAKIDGYAWHFGNSPNENYAKVGLKKPNPWGLHDMHGNVSEWVLDGYEPYQPSFEIVENPLRVPMRLYPRVVRGGSYWDDAEDLRSAARGKSSPEWKQSDPTLPKSIWWHCDAPFFGFRIVRPLKRPTDAELTQKWDQQTPKNEREKWLETRRKAFEKYWREQQGGK